MSKYISKFSGSEVDAYISKIINGEVVLENTINKVEENKQNPVTSDTLYNIFKEINDNFKSVNKNIDVFKKQIEEIIKGDVGLLSDIIGVDDNGDVFIKPDGDNPRNFYTRGTISFGGSTDNDTEPTIIANLSDLLDVSLKDITNGQSLVYENGYWVNKEIKTGLTDEEINNMLNPINTKITNLENKVNPLEARIAFFENIIGVDKTTGDVYIKNNGDLPRNFYTHGTISFGGLSINEDVSVVNKISDLSDVFINNISANQILVWDTNVLNNSGSYGAWVNKDLEQGLNTEELSIYLKNNEYVQKTYVDDRITDLINGAPAAYDTLKEIADVLSSNVNSIGDIMLTLSKKADKGTTLADYGITDALDNTTKYALADSVGGNALNALKLGGQGPLYYATAVGLTEVSDRVKTLEDVIGIDKNGDVYIKDNNGNPRNFYTYGTISFSGLDIGSGDSPSTGNITISIDGEEFTSTNGYVELPSYPTALKNPYALTINGRPYDGSEAVDITISGGGGVADSVDWANVANKPTTLAGYGITDALSLSGGTLSGQGAILSLNGYEDSSIHYKVKGVLKTSVGFYNNFSFIADETTGYRIGVTTEGIAQLWNNYNGSSRYNILHSGNYSDYALSKNGGVVGDLVINATSDAFLQILLNGTSKALVGWQSNHGVRLYNYASASYLSIKDDGTPTYNGNTLYHSGNFNPADYLPKSGGFISSSGWGNQLNILRAEAGDSVIRFFNQNTDNYLGAIGFDNDSNLIVNVKNVGNANILHSSNYSSYALPLSGGTISGNTTLARNVYLLNDLGRTMLGFDGWDIYIGSNEQNTYIRGVGVSINGTITMNGNTPIHSGNIGSQSVNYANSAGNADTLDGYHADIMVKSHIDSTDNFTSFTDRAFFKTAWISGQGDFNSLIIPTWTGNNTGNYYITELRFYLNSWNPSVRYTHNDFTTDWKTLALISDNVASATKLQTARSIWGQSFDGTANVSGKLTNATALAFNTDCGVYQGSLFSASMTEYDIAYYGTNHYFHNFSSGYNLIIKENGNVLIGTIYDNGAKLQVNGKMSAHDYEGGNFSSNHADSFVENDKTIPWYGLSVYEGYTKGVFLTGYSAVHIHTAYCRFTLDSVGGHLNHNLTVTGTLTFGSDIRYKDIIENTSIDIETIANAPLFNYKWNDRNDEKIHLGTSAQYWYKTAFKNAVVPTTDEKLWTMGYAEIALGNTITLAKELIPIKKEVNKIKVLEERVKKLENILIANNIIFD